MTDNAEYLKIGFEKIKKQSKTFINKILFNFFRKMKKIIIFLLLNLLSHHSLSISASMEIDWSDEYSCYMAPIKITGSINDGDSELFAFLIKQLHSKFSVENCKGSRVFIDSNGGSVIESLKIGEIIRANEMQVWIGQNSKCYSSCVYILAAGVDRLAFGNVGIHRPYYTKLDPKTPIEEVRRQRDLLNEKIKSYLKQMDVSLKLFEDSLAIEPENIKILSDSEKKMYRIDGEDASYQELKTALFADMYNLPLSEYRIRFQKMIKICSIHLSNPIANANCTISVMLGTNEIESNKLREKIAQECVGKQNKSAIACRKKVMYERR